MHQERARPTGSMVQKPTVAKTQKVVPAMMICKKNLLKEKAKEATTTKENKRQQPKKNKLNIEPGMYQWVITQTLRTFSGKPGAPPVQRSVIKFSMSWARTAVVFFCEASVCNSWAEAWPKQEAGIDGA